MAVPSFIYRSVVKLFPRAAVEIKSGTRREALGLELASEDGGTARYVDKERHVELLVSSTEREGGTAWKLRLRNLRDRSVRITRLRLPAWNGLDELLPGVDPARVSFLRNGYQSWSTVRSYRMTEKPLRPRLRLVSLVTSNLANLPSNSPGELSSEMYTVVADLDSGNSVLVGQRGPFDQFLYIFLHLLPGGPRRSFFELVYDFGRKVLPARAELALDGLWFASGRPDAVTDGYFDELARESGYRRPGRSPLGWCSWYQYYDRIDPDKLYANLKGVKESGLPFDFFQIDDGWQKGIGDWLETKPAFDGRMKELADAIKAAGLRPGLWFAPFAVSRVSTLFREHPEYLLRDERGAPLPAGYNPIWKGIYHGLDATHPRFREYLSEVVDRMVKEWGFEYLKCDFLFAACLRGGNLHELGLSRAEALKSGMRLIRERAGARTTLVGCGMPLSAGIGTVDAMRVGPDTGDFWIRVEGKLLRTGAMVGLRNSLRATLVRSPMHGTLWTNDPDCVMARRKDTKLGSAEIMAQFHAVAVSGGLVAVSDEWGRLEPSDVAELGKLMEISAECSKGRAAALDFMEREMPEQFHNDAGWIAFFNWEVPTRSKRFDLSAFRARDPRAFALVDAGTGERFEPLPAVLDLGPMKARSSRLFRVVRG